MAERYYDDDRPPRGSPRLSSKIDSIPDARSPFIAVLPRPTKKQIDRLRRDIAIYAAIESGMSQRMAGKVFALSKTGILSAYRRIDRRKNRV